jgi:hypothetical protein
VNNAEPGDVLEVRHKRIRSYEWGATFNNPSSVGTGLLAQDYPQGQVKYVDLAQSSQDAPGGGYALAAYRRAPQRTTSVYAWGIVNLVCSSSGGSVIKVPPFPSLEITKVEAMAPNSARLAVCVPSLTVRFIPVLVLFSV